MHDQPQNLADLVRQAADGDRAAFARLIDLHERTALGLAYAVVGCAATAADVAQDAFLRAWQRLGELDDPERFPAWLGRIVRNLAVDSIRRRPRHELPTDTGGLGDLPAEPADPHDRLERDERQRHVAAAIDALDEISRMIVTLRYFNGLTSRQIAEVVGLSPAAVDMRLSRARAQLRSILNPDPSPLPSADERNGRSETSVVDTLACAGGGAA